MKEAHKSLQHYASGSMTTVSKAVPTQGREQARHTRVVSQSVIGNYGQNECPPKYAVLHQEKYAYYPMTEQRARESSVKEKVQNLVAELQLASNQQTKHVRRNTASEAQVAEDEFKIVEDELVADMPKPRKVDAGSFAEAAKLVTIDIGRRSRKA